MNFAQHEYPLFLLAVLIGYWLIARRRWQNLLLLLASCIFYGWVHPWFVLLLAVSIFVDYGCARGMVRWPERKKRFLLISLVANLSLLGVFKYLDFFISSVALVMDKLGLAPHPQTLGILLPVGISFFTFQSMSYTIDVYRGKIEARESLVDVATYVAMFPQLVAGPIERARNLLPQLEAPRRFALGMFCSGLGLVLWGAIKKIVIADTVALYVDSVYAMEDPSWGLIWAATLGFQMQILADFSGYTDIARGSARMLGFELMENFKAPYGASNPSDFWRRWHISLSSWIHEYLYVSMGGSRRGVGRMILATATALMLSGLWHGASWNFVLWGLYYVVLMLAYRFLTPLVPDRLASWAVARAGAVGLYFSFTCIGLVLFRERRLARIIQYYTLDPRDGSSEQWILASMVASVAIGAGLVLWLGGWMQKVWLPRIADKPWRLPVRTVLWTLAVLVLYIFARDTAHDFVYFQF